MNLSKHLSSAVCALLLCSGLAWAENITFPSGANVRSVTSYGATPSDGSDDTVAIQDAIEATIGQNRTLYFPNGTYNVSNRLEWKNTAGDWRCGLTLQGQSRAGVVLKLADNVFTDPANPKAMIRTATQNAPKSDGSGTGQAFSNSIRNLTLDTGSGNTGAIGVDYLSNNEGTIADVTIRSGDSARRGIAGISMKREWPGPCLIKNVLISGFNYGVDVSQWEYSQVYEDLTIQNQLVAGVRNAQNVLSIRNLQSTNSVPALLGTDGEGTVVLMDSVLSGGANSHYAVNFKGSLFVRNLSTSGYAAAIYNANGSGAVAGASHGQYNSHSIQRRWSDSQPFTLGLPVEDPPLWADENTVNWAVVNASASDDTANLQAAMNAGKATVCIPNGGGTLRISGTITVPAGVRRIIGCEAAIEAVGTLASSAQPAFRFSGGSDSITFERTTFYPFTDDSPFWWFEHASTRPLVLRNLTIFGGQGYRNTTTGGKVFLDDVAGKKGWYFTGQQVWARQFNPENPTGPLIRNDGGTLWILGLKTEGPSTCIETLNGGSTELLGGLLYPLTASSSTPAFLDNESKVTLSYTETGAANYTVHVREIRGGETRDQTRSLNQSAGLKRDGKAMTLYSGWTGGGPGTTLGAALWLKADSGVTKDGSNWVSLWEDKSGNDADATQSTSANRPLWVSGAVNGQPALRFNGTEDFLNLPSGFQNFVNGVTAFVVLKPTNTGNWARFFDLGNGQENNNLLLGRFGTEQSLAYRSLNGATRTGPTASSALTTNSWQMVEVVHDDGGEGVTTTARLYRNGTLQATGSATVPRLVTRTQNRIARSSTATDAYFAGDIAEILIYPRALSDAERQDVESYLSGKYGLSLGASALQTSGASGASS